MQRLQLLQSSSRCTSSRCPMLHLSSDETQGSKRSAKISVDQFKYELQSVRKAQGNRLTSRDGATSSVQEDRKKNARCRCKHEKACNGLAFCCSVRYSPRTSADNFIQSFLHCVLSRMTKHRNSSTSYLLNINT